MTTAKKKETVENTVETTEEIQQEEIQQKAASDHKLILAPLARYGVIAILMVGIIVTTAIMMDREFNDIDSQVTALETEIALQNQAEQLTEQAVTEGVTAESVATTEETVTETPDAFARAINTTPVATAPEVTQPATAAPVEPTPVATTPVTEAPVTTTAQAPYEAFDHKARIAEHNDFMAKQDQKQLDTFKANQEKQIEMLRAQLVKQQERIEAIEKRNLETYEMRKAAIERMQEARQQSMNRI